MSRFTTSVSIAALTGTAVSMDAASANGQKIKNTRGDVMLIITTAGTPANVTVLAQQTSRPGDGAFPPQTVGNQVIAMGSTETRVAGPFPSSYNDANGDLLIDFSATTNVKIGAARFPS